MSIGLDDFVHSRLELCLQNSRQIIHIFVP